MLLPFAVFRPDCEKIQDEKSMWYTGIKEIQDMAQLNEYMQSAETIWEIQDNFHLYFLKKKIESANVNQNKTDRTTSLLLDFKKDDKYELEFNQVRVIGSGSFGIVTEVQEKVSNKIFAIKMIPIEQNYNQSSIREVEIMTKLNDNYVVKCKSIWIEDHSTKTLYENNLKILPKSKPNESSVFKRRIEKPFLLLIQMELCFQTLKQAIEKMNNELKQVYFKRMTPVGYYVACELMIELLEGVDYLHRLVPAVIHRDLKPSNILISFGLNDRFIKIADFGLSTLHENDDQSHTVGIGTRNYMAPEVQTKKYDTRCDIYSLGFIIYDVFNFEFKK
jgi:serine/threonine protein kinase